MDILHLPVYDKIYQIVNPLATKPFLGELLEEGEAIRWAFQITKGDAKPEKPVIVKYLSGSPNPANIIWTSSVYPIIIQEKILELFIASNFTGWSTYSVEVYDKCNKLVPNYYGLAITGRCGSINYDKSEIIYKELPSGSFPHLKGVYFPVTTWDGSDFFMEVPDTMGLQMGTIFVTEKVVRTFNKENVTNIKFVKITEKITDIDSIKIGAPHRLPARFKHMF
jgi:hypothetical protein